MLEFKLDNFSWNEERCQKILRDLYKSILHNDTRWHFFWEGSYTVIRCLESSKHAVEGFLKKKKQNFEVYDWEENVPITAKYYHQFSDMFHCFSVLAMIMEDGEFFQILERICHCFLNNCLTNDRVSLATKGVCDYSLMHKLWEAQCLNAIASARAYTDGFQTR